MIEAGYMTLPSSLISVAAGLVVARAISSIGGSRLITLGSLLTAIGAAVSAFAHDEKRQMYLASGLTGLGVITVFACLANAIVDAVPPEQTGVATGMNANIRTVGGAIGSAIAATLITAQTQPSWYPAEPGYINAFAFVIVAAVAAAMAGPLIPRARRLAAPSSPGESKHGTYPRSDRT